MPEKLARSVVVTPCCRHHSLTERPLLRHSWICAAHSCSSARCFNSALVILTSHNTTVAKPFATFSYYCLMCVYARLGLTVTQRKSSPEERSPFSRAALIHPALRIHSKSKVAFIPLSLKSNLFRNRSSKIFDKIS